jgi:diacylglycerol kinase (ATP)
VPRTASKVPSDGDQVLILVNPTAGRRSATEKVGRLAKLLRQRGHCVELSCDLDHVCRQANEAHRRGVLRALVGVGGDGTAAELVNRTQPGVPISLYPSGTSNLLARHLGLAASPRAVCDAIGHRALLKMDAGLASGRVFLLMASCGFDAEVVHEVHRRRQQALAGHLTYWSYVKPIIDAIRRYQYPEIWVELDYAPGAQGEASRTFTTRWVFVSNCPTYGWGLSLAPWADATDGALDLCTFEGGSLWNGLRYLVAAQVGWHRRLRDCVVSRVRRLRIGSDRPVMYQLDGDPGGSLPLEIEVLPRRVTLVVPAPSRGP